MPSTLTQSHDASWALTQLKAGRKVKRKAWWSRYLWQEGNTIRCADQDEPGTFVTGLSNSDLTATDWELA